MTRHSTDEPATYDSVAPHVLVIGEALIDIVESGGASAEHVGGSPANAALTLARLGRRTTLVTELGDDLRGRRIIEHLSASGATVLYGEAARTSTARAVLCADGSAEYSFDLSWNLPDIDTSHATHVHTGSIAVQLEPGGSATVELLEALPATVTASVDANIRPDLIGEHGVGVGVTRFERVAAHCEVVKLSDEDARWLYPDMGLDDVLSRLLELGAQLAVATRGDQGLMLVSPVARVSVPAAEIVVADTIGAGDSAMGAILDEAFRQGLGTSDGMLLDEPSLRAIGRWAVRVAGATASRRGADPPTRAEL